mgnify:CR=1 FL=1
MNDHKTSFEAPAREVGDASFAAQLGEAGALQHGGDAFHALADSMPQMIWSTLPDGHHDYYNARWYEFTGAPKGSTDGEGWAGMFHEDDQPEAWKRWRHSLATGESYEVEYRLRHHSGEYRWVLGRASPIVGRDGEILRWMGTCTDINEAKGIADHNDVLSRELSHRIKNIFAVISGLIGMTARSNAAFREPVRDLQDRIAALGRAHEFVRPHSETSRPELIAVTLHGMLKEIFAAYPAFVEGRLAIAGDDIEISNRGATPIALVFHELATNSMKYGALSVDDGRVAVTVHDDGAEVVCDWRESGGPAIVDPPTREGFGSRLTELAVRQQLGGSFERQWRREGLQMTIRAKRARLVK